MRGRCVTARVTLGAAAATPVLAPDAGDALGGTRLDASSIEAAAHPEPGSWLFFVTVDPGTGETKFATTQAEHDRNVREFQAWCRAHSDRC